ncbi:uncharacterized protein [Argopecten irradians]|uniref:uncharacterized protein n=1 Tax=Argopecten irradians TaxID=31199 RepID=UPI003710AB8C
MKDRDVLPLGSQNGITLPTGARVDVSLRTNRLKYFFDIAIIPTNHEENNVITGLCGNLDSDSYNDCISRWGQAPCAEPPPDNDANLYIGGYSYSPHTFTESFRIPEEESLLYVEPNLNLIPPYPRSKLSCVCPHNGTEQCSLKEYISCDLQRHELSCMKPSISDYYNRRKREVPVQSVLGDNDRTERSSSVMTESEAIAACTQALTSSPVYTTCTSIGIPSSELQACTADLMLTGNPQWAVYAMDRFQSTCLDTITKNATLQEIFPDALDNIKQNTCPNDCYGNGVCSNGECVCKEGFASDDCSFDLSMPLTLSGLRNGDLCDLKNGCDAISIQGHQFPYGRDYTCQFTGQMTLTNLSVYTLNVTNMTAQYRSIFELLCNLPEIESTSGKLGVEFNVSVSMDSSEFSTPWNFVVIDTTCQSFSYDEGTVSFHMKDGFCYIEGECVLNGAHNREDFCKECYSTQKSFDWSEATDCAVSADGDDSHVTVIAAVTCSVTIGLLLCLGLGLYCWKLSTIKPHGRADVVQNIHFHQRQHLDQMRKRKHTKMLSITSISNKIEPLPLADICN